MSRGRAAAKPVRNLLETQPESLEQLAGRDVVLAPGGVQRAAGIVGVVSDMFFCRCHSASPFLRISSIRAKIASISLRFLFFEWNIFSLPRDKSFGPSIRSLR